MDGSHSEHYAPAPGLVLVKGVLSHAAETGRNKDHIVAVVGVRRAYYHAEPRRRSSSLATTTGCAVVATCKGQGIDDRVNVQR